MHRTMLLVLFLVPTTLLFGVGRATGDDRSSLKDALALEEAVQDAIQKAEVSVACIAVSRGKDVPALVLANPEHVPEAYGSGVVVDSKGLIITNYHVVRDATQIYVRLPGKIHSFAEIYAADPRSDLAVLRLTDLRGMTVPAIKKGDGSKVRKGMFVLSIANPFAAGFPDGNPSASWGIISNISRRSRSRQPLKEERERSLMPLSYFSTMLQIDARLNLGCSGGALINLRGELIGLTNSLAAITGGETAGGFAMPVVQVDPLIPMDRIVAELEKGKEVEYGFLGISFQPGLGGQVNRGEGVGLRQVFQGSPAAKGGLQEFDTILAVDGAPVYSNDDLLLAIGTRLAGSKAELKVRSHDGQVRVASVTLAKYLLSSKVIASVKPTAFRGLRVDYTSLLVQRNLLTQEIPTGVYVREVEAGSPADSARLQEAVISHVNGQPVTNPAEFYRAVQNLNGPVELTLAPRDRTEGSRKVKLD